MHVHENASCAPAEKDGKMVAGLAAGGHYDPMKTNKHAGPGKAGHKGDLPHIMADAEGVAKAKLHAPNLQAKDLKGHSVMIHEGGDNYTDNRHPQRRRRAHRLRASLNAVRNQAHTFHFPSVDRPRRNPAGFYVARPCSGRRMAAMVGNPFFLRGACLNPWRATARSVCPDFAGRSLSLPDNPESGSAWGVGKDVLLLGLGPGRPEDLPFAQGGAGCARVFWLDEPETLRRLEVARPVGGRRSLPGHWQQVTPEDIVALAARCSVFFYRPGLRLAPDFWGPLLGRLGAARLEVRTRRTVIEDATKHAAEEGGRRPVLLPGTERQLPA